MDDAMSLKKEDPEGLFDAIFKNWHIVLILVSIIYSWAHFQNDLQTLQDKIQTDELQANTLNANYIVTSNNIASINAKLDIIIKHDGL